MESRLRRLLESVVGRRRERPKDAERSGTGDAMGGAPSRLIVGLGNPGRRYAGNRHNIGFMVIDALAESLGLSIARRQHNAFVATADLGGNRVLLVKPQTYMNLSGQAIRQLADWYKLSAADVLVVYDDLDLPLGRVRIRPKGSSGGHRGMQSIIQHIGAQDIARVKIGIGRSATQPPEEYVLRDFAPSERLEIREGVQKAVDAIRAIVTKGIETAMTELN